MEHGLFSTFSNHAVGGGASPTSTGITLLPWLSPDTISTRTKSLGLSSRRLPAPSVHRSRFCRLQPAVHRIRQLARPQRAQSRGRERYCGHLRRAAAAQTRPEADRIGNPYSRSSPRCLPVISRLATGKLRNNSGQYATSVVVPMPRGLPLQKAARPRGIARATATLFSGSCSMPADRREARAKTCRGFRRPYRSSPDECRRY